MTQKRPNAGFGRRMSRREVLGLGAAGAGAVLLGGCGGGAGSSGGTSSSSGTGGVLGSNKNKKITFGSIGWTEDVALSNLSKVVMEKDLGYGSVDIKGPLELGPLFLGVAGGGLTAFQDVWMPNNKNYLNSAKVKPKVELLPPWFEGKTKYGLAVPMYMKKKGIVSIADLNKAGTNVITGIEPSASFMPVIRNKVIPGYNLHMKLVTSSTAAMLAELQKKYSAKQPIVIPAWSPHWMNKKYDLWYLKDPKGLEKPFSNSSKLQTVVNKNLKNDDPVTYAFLKAVRLTADQVNSLELEIKKAGSDNPIKGVNNWLAKGNHKVVEPWIKAARKAAGQA